MTAYYFKTLAWLYIQFKHNEIKSQRRACQCKWRLKWFLRAFTHLGVVQYHSISSPNRNMLNSRVSTCPVLILDRLQKPERSHKLIQSKVQRRARHLNTAAINVIVSISELQNIKAHWPSHRHKPQIKRLALQREFSSDYLAHFQQTCYFIFLLLAHHLRKACLTKIIRNGYCAFLTSAVTSFENCSWQKTGKHSKSCLQM